MRAPPEESRLPYIRVYAKQPGWAGNGGFMYGGGRYDNMVDPDVEHVVSRLRKLDRHLLALVAERIQLTRKIADRPSAGDRTSGAFDYRDWQTEIRRCAAAEA